MRWDYGNNGPFDPENVAHVVLIFLKEVHQDGGEISPGRHGVAMFRMMEELRQQMLTHGTFNNAKPVSDHHPMNVITGRKSYAILSYEGENGMRPVFTTAKWNLSAKSSWPQAIANKTTLLKRVSSGQLAFQRAFDSQ